MSDKNIDLHNRLSDHIFESLQKFIYYILGLTAASVAYSIHFIIEHITEKWIGILLASVFLWAITFGVGINSVLMQTKLILLNQNRLKGHATEDQLIRFNSKMDKHLKLVIIFFGSGFVPYVVWIVKSLL